MMVSRKTTCCQGHKPDRTEQEPHYIERFPRWLCTVLTLALRASSMWNWLWCGDVTEV